MLSRPSPRLSRRGAPLRAINRVAAVVRQEAGKDGIYLVPLRAFIGIGWIRAHAEKAVDPNWADGSTLSSFLQTQGADGRIPFPFYQDLTAGYLLPHAETLAWVILIGQLLAGLAILTGTLTPLALLGGLFMNLNFVLAGATDPSAFYIVIQLLLLVCGAGMVFGVDGWVAARRRRRFRNAQPPNASGRVRFRCFLLRVLCIPLALAAAAGGVLAIPYIRDYSPEGSIHDPAALLTTLGFVTATWAFIAFLHAGQRAANLRRTLLEQSAPDPLWAPHDRRSPRPPRSQRRRGRAG